MNENPISTSKALTNAAPSNPEHGRQARKRLLIATLVTLGLMFLPYVAAYVFGGNVGIALYRFNQILLFPLRMFITLVHETGHALAGLLTGNRVDYVQVRMNGSGETLATGTLLTSWIINSAGYLGTTIFGAAMLQIGRLRNLRHPGRTALFFASCAVLAITLVWGWHDPFTLVVGLGLAAGFFALARFASPGVADFLATFLAVQCGLNALGDISNLLLLTNSGEMATDAGNMAKQYALPAMFWALLWAIAAIVILFFGLRSYWRATQK